MSVSFRGEAPSRELNGCICATQKPPSEMVSE
jgi:hypothetical protein